MKKIVLSVALFATTALVFAQKKVADVAKFATETIDLGKIKQGNPTKGTFTVTNISKDALIIEQANPTCGCTISDYTKEPIAAGKNGVINATYNAAGAGHFEKHLTVKFAGVDELKSITLTGDVLTAEEYDKWKAENDTKVKPAAVTEVKPAVTPVKSTKKVKKAKTKKAATAAATK